MKETKINIEHEKWILDRIDKWRVYNSSRSSIILSVDAIMLTGILFMTQKIIELINNVPPFFFYLVISLIIILIIILIVSIYFASTGIVNLFTTSRDMYGKSMPDRIYFHPSDVVNDCKSYDDFVNKYSNLPEEKIREGLWAELWTITRVQYKQYQFIRKSLKLLIFGIAIFCVNILLIVLLQVYKVNM